MDAWPPVTSITDGGRTYLYHVHATHTPSTHGEADTANTAGEKTAAHDEHHESGVKVSGMKQQTSLTAEADARNMQTRHAPSAHRHATNTAEKRLIARVACCAKLRFVLFFLEAFVWAPTTRRAPPAAPCHGKATLHTAAITCIL
jgi:hypothetical protein